MVIAMSSAPFLAELKARLPCRSQQIDQLYGLYGVEGEPCPPSIYINGGPSVGKSVVVESVLQKLCVRYAVINLIECYTTKILFESILNKLFGIGAKCDNMMDFVQTLQKELVQENNQRPTVLVIDKAEKFLNMDYNLFSSFLKLNELIEFQSISVIFLSELVLQKFYTKMNIVEPIRITFPQYSKDELLEILCLDVGRARDVLVTIGSKMVDFDLEFYQNYLNVFLSVFYRNCRDLAELRYVALKNFPHYIAPIQRGEHTVNDLMALWRKIAPTLKQSLDSLYLRTITNDEQMEQRQQGEFLSQLELPYYAKYLLIAAYLASYNNPKDDKRIFMKYHGKKRKTVHDIKAKNLVSEKLNTQLGPKPFSLDRLLAIFYSILEDKVGFNNNLLVQVSSLVELQLLSSLSDNSTLDGPKYKCNVNFDFIQAIAKTLAFNIRKYLSDFAHM